MKINVRNISFTLALSMIGATSSFAESVIYEATNQVYESKCVKAKKDLNKIQTSQYKMSTLREGTESRANLAQLQAEYDREKARLVLLKGMQEIKVGFDNFVKKTSTEIESKNPLFESLDTMIKGAKATKRMGVMHSMVGELIKAHSDEESKKAFFENGKLPKVEDGNFYAHLKKSCKDNKAETVGKEIDMCLFINDNSIHDPKTKSMTQEAWSSLKEVFSGDIKETVNGFYKAISKREDENGELDKQELKEYYDILTSNPSSSRTKDLDIANYKTKYLLLHDTDSEVAKAIENQFSEIEYYQDRLKTDQNKEKSAKAFKQCKKEYYYGAVSKECSTSGDLIKEAFSSGGAKYSSAMNELKSNMNGLWGLTLEGKNSDGNIKNSPFIKDQASILAGLKKGENAGEEFNNNVAQRMFETFNRLKQKARSVDNRYENDEALKSAFGPFVDELENGNLQAGVMKALCSDTSVLDKNFKIDSVKMMTCLQNSSDATQDKIEKQISDANEAVTKKKNAIARITNSKPYNRLKAIKKFALDEVFKNCHEDTAEDEEHAVRCFIGVKDGVSFSYIKDSSNKLISQIEFDLLGGKVKQKGDIKAAREACHVKQMKHKYYQLGKKPDYDEDGKPIDFQQKALGNFFKYSCSQIEEAARIAKEGTPQEKRKRYFKKYNRMYDSESGKMIEQRKDSTAKMIAKSGIVAGLDLVGPYAGYKHSQWQIGNTEQYLKDQKQYYHNLNGYYEYQYGLYEQYGFPTYTSFGSGYPIYYNTTGFNW